MLLWIAAREENLEFARVVIAHLKDADCMERISRDDNCAWYVAQLLRDKKACGGSIVMAFFKEFSVEQVSSVIGRIYAILVDKSDIKPMYADLCELLGKQIACYDTKELLRKVVKSAQALYLEEELKPHYCGLMRGYRFGMAKLAMEVALEEKFAVDALYDKGGGTKGIRLAGMEICPTARQIGKLVFTFQNNALELFYEQCLIAVPRLEAAMDFLVINTKLNMLCKDTSTCDLIIPAEIFYNLLNVDPKDIKVAKGVLKKFLSGCTSEVEIRRDLTSTNFDILTLICEPNSRPLLVDDWIVEPVFERLLAHKYPKLLEYTKGHQDVSPGSL